MFLARVAGDDSDNRFLLIDLCRGLDLSVANTSIQQPSVRQLTYKNRVHDSYLLIILVGTRMTLHS